MERPYLIELILCQERLKSLKFLGLAIMQILGVYTEIVWYTNHEAQPYLSGGNWINCDLEISHPQETARADSSLGRLISLAFPAVRVVKNSFKE